MFKALTFALRLLLAAVESLFWILSAGLAALGIGGDALRSRKALVAGTASCPAGHSFPTEGGTYECGQCSFVYRGSIWACGNPECRATTPYVNCPVCGLSVRSPYRWGRQ